jgi:hypothetical protein
VKALGDWRHGSAIINLSTRWNWVVSLTPLLPYPQGKSSQDPVGGHQSQYVHHEQEKNVYQESNSDSLVVMTIAHCYISWAMLVPASLEVILKCKKTDECLVFFCSEHTVIMVCYLLWTLYCFLVCCMIMHSLKTTRPYSITGFGTESIKWSCQQRIIRWRSPSWSLW